MNAHVLSEEGACAADVLAVGSGGRFHVKGVIGNAVIEDAAHSSDGSGACIGADSDVSTEAGCRTSVESGCVNGLKAGCVGNRLVKELVMR